MIILGENEKFVEVPDGSMYSYRKHQYEIVYKLTKPNELHIGLVANTSNEKIELSENKAFKVYAKPVSDNDG